MGAHPGAPPATHWRCAFPYAAARHQQPEHRPDSVGRAEPAAGPAVRLRHPRGAARAGAGRRARLRALRQPAPRARLLRQAQGRERPAGRRPEVRHPLARRRARLHPHHAQAGAVDGRLLPVLPGRGAPRRPAGRRTCARQAPQAPVCLPGDDGRGGGAAGGRHLRQEPCPGEAAARSGQHGRGGADGRAAAGGRRLAARPSRPWPGAACCAPRAAPWSRRTHSPACAPSCSSPPP